MSSQSPASTQSSDSGVYQLPALGSRPLMTTARQTSQRHQTLPPPSALDNQRPRLPLPSHLDPPFTPHVPQHRPLYSDLPGRNRAPNTEQASSQGSAPPSDTSWSAPAPHRGVAQGNAVSLPPLYPPGVAHQPRASATSYESLSPTEHVSHGPMGRSSLFDDSTYSARPFSSGSQLLHSPASSHQSSTTTSSGQPSRSLYDPRPLGPPGEVVSKAESKGKEQDMFERYIFTVRQQPEAARACGFGERDRRVIDPPAIVQLSFKDFDPDSPADVALLQYPFHIVHCSLFTVPTEASEAAPLSDVTSVPDPSKINALCRRLMGTLVASPFVGIDPEAKASSNENAKLGCFFIFPDLSVRQTGRYRLRFTLMKVPMHELIEGGQGSIAAFVDSDIFEVYVAGAFPGMSASSHLIKELKRQGAAVSLKKGIAPGKSAKRTGDASEKSGSDNSDDAQTSATKIRQKKKRG